jgi:hypothetical protein
LQSLNEDTVEVSLNIDILKEEHFTTYYLIADNDIDSYEVKFELREGAPSKNPNPGYSHSSQGPSQSAILLVRRPYCSLLSLQTQEK